MVRRLLTTNLYPLYHAALSSNLPTFNKRAIKISSTLACRKSLAYSTNVPVDSHLCLLTEVPVVIGFGLGAVAQENSAGLFMVLISTGHYPINKGDWL
jgi:hypothetical protein